jgi:hypothetical protein
MSISHVSKNSESIEILVRDATPFIFNVVMRIAVIYQRPANVV